MRIHDWIDDLFESWGRQVCRFPLLSIAVFALFVVAIGSQVPKLELELSLEGYLTSRDEAKRKYQEFREIFGTDERIVIALTPEDVFALSFLEKLRAMEEDIEASVPYVDEVTSLISARQTRGEGDTLVVDELLDDWPESEAELADFARRVRANPLYRNLLISGNERLVTLSIETDANAVAGALSAEASFDDFEQESNEGESRRSAEMLSTEQIREIVTSLYALMERHADPAIPMHISGAPVRNFEMASVTVRDMTRFFGVMIGVIAISLLLLFRRLSAVVYPILVASLSVLSTLGAMALLGIPITGSTQLLPSLLLAVGIGDSIHILTIFYRQLGLGMDKREAIVFSLRHSGMAVFMTSLTTAGSMSAFAAADLAPLVGLGIAAPLGVMLAFLFSVFLLPALLLLTPGIEGGQRRAQDRSSPASFRHIDRLLVAAGDLGTHHPYSVLGVTLVILIVAGIGAARVPFTHDVENWFPADYPLRVANDLLNTELEGVYSLEVLLETGEENGLQDPALLQAMDELAIYAESLQIGEVGAGKVISLVPIVKEIHQALNENQPAYYTLPEDRALIAQELLLFESSGSDDLEDVTDPQFSTGRMTLFLPATDAFYYLPFIDHLKEKFRERLGEEIGISFTGIVALLSRTMQMVVTSMAKTYLVAFGIIAVLMILVMGEVRAGLIAMIPNLAPIFITVGLMGWTGISFNIATILLGCIAIGIAVDDTIHFMQSFRRYYRESGDAVLAVRQTMQTTGRALLVTSLILTLGFSAFSVSILKNVFYFGLVNASAIVFAFLCDVILAPALVVLMTRRDARR